MQCPNCGHEIQAKEILKYRQQELASRPRPGFKGKPSNNPYGRKGKPKPEKETGK